MIGGMIQAANERLLDSVRLAANRNGFGQVGDG